MISAKPWVRAYSQITESEVLIGPNSDQWIALWPPVESALAQRRVRFMSIDNRVDQLAKRTSPPRARLAANASLSNVFGLEVRKVSQEIFDRGRAARASTIMPTVTRIPRIGGLPLSSGSMVMRCSCCTWMMIPHAAYPEDRIEYFAAKRWRTGSHRGLRGE